MDKFIDKLVEINSWVTSYFMEPYDSYKRRKGYMEKTVRAIAEAMENAPDGRLLSILQYMADVVSNQMSLGKIEAEREKTFSALSEVINSLIDLLSILKEGKGIERYEGLKERMFDILDTLNFKVNLGTIWLVRNLLSELYRVTDRAFKVGKISDKLLATLDEVVFILGQMEDRGLAKALETLKGMDQ